MPSITKRFVDSLLPGPKEVEYWDDTPASVSASSQRKVAFPQSKSRDLPSGSPAIRSLAYQQKFGELQDLSTKLCDCLIRSIFKISADTFLAHKDLDDIEKRTEQENLL